MEKLKKLFSTPERKIITVVCIVLILAIAGAGTVLAVRVGAQHNAIGEENARNFAFADAGLAPADVTFTKTRLDTEDGFAVYDIDFYTADAEYEYEIDAETGEVFSRSREVWDGGRPAAQPSASPSEAPSASPAGEEYISATEAEDAALADAGLAASDVTFTKEKFDRDDGRAVYDIEFYSGDAEYEYEIDAVTGEVINRSKEMWDGGRPGAQPTAAPTAAPSETPTAVPTAAPTSDSYIGLDAAKAAALADAGPAASDVTFTKQVFDRENGRAVYNIEFYSDDAEYEYEIDAVTGEVISRSKEIWDGGRPGAQPTAAPTAAPSETPTAVPTAAPTSDSYIGLDAAEDAALADAGLAASDVTFTKEKFDRDDGRAVYDIEFYSGDAEYEYEIDAVTGEVISRSKELLPAAQPSAAPTGDSFIGEEAAKAAALADAGPAASDVTFTKQVFDREDGRAVYEIEFYSDDAEYEYEIDAVTGEVLERDVDHDHH